MFVSIPVVLRAARPPSGGHPTTALHGCLSTPLLIEQKLLDGFRRIVETMTVSLLVRLDLVHVDLARRHRRQEHVEIVEVGP